MDTARDFFVGRENRDFCPFRSSCSVHEEMFCVKSRVHSKMTMTRLILVNHAYLWIHSRWQHDGMIAAASRIMAEILTVSCKSYHYI